MQRIDWNAIWRALKKRSPEVLTGFGIGGMLTTTVLAVMATPKAMRRIEEQKTRLHRRKLTPTQTIQAAWTCYIPAGLSGIASTACLVGASTINGRRNAALATAAGFAQSSLMEYRGKVAEAIGEKKEESIRSAIDRENLEKNPPSEKECVLPEGEGHTLCRDAMFGRYFYSDIEFLRQTENKLNRQMATMTEPYISLNEFYMEIGIPTVDIGDELGWNVDKGLIELSFTSQLARGRIPCLVMNYANPPQYRYY